MKNKTIIFCIFLCACIIRLQGQLPSFYESSVRFQEGLELFRQEQYQASSLAFEQYLAIANQGGRNGLGAQYTADAQYYKALCAWHLDRPDAESQLRAFIQNNPVHVSVPMARIWLARNTFRSKLYRETLRELAPLSIPDAWLPDSVNQEVQYMAGICHYQFRENGNALKHFSALARESGPYQVEAIRYTGILHHELHNYAASVEVLNTLPTKAQTSETVLAKARSLFALDSLEVLLQFTRDLPDALRDPELYLTLAATSIRRENYSEALQWFEQYQKSRTLINPALKYQYGYAAYQENNYSLAIPIFEQLSIQADSLSSLAAYYLAFCYLKEGRTETARLAFLKASSDRYTSSLTEDAVIQYAKISFQEKYFDDAMRQLKGYIQNYPKGKHKQEALGLLGEVFFFARNYKESVAYFESALLKDARSLSAYQRSCYYYGLDLYQKGAYQEADIYFRKGLNQAHDPEITAGCKYWYAESLFRQGHYRESARQFQHFLDMPISPRPAYYQDAWYGLGWALLKQELALDAAEAFIRFLNSSDKRQSSTMYHDALLRTGDCEFSLKNYQEALRYFQEAVQLSIPQIDYAIWRIAQIQYRTEQYSASVENCKKIIQQYKTSDYRDEALHLAAETSLKWLIDYKAASQFSRTLVQEHAMSVYVPAAWNRMGIAAYNSNDKPAAEKFFRKVLVEYCQDTAVARSALNNLNFIVPSETYVEIFTEYRQKCPEVNESLELVSWEAASDKYTAEQWQDAVALLNLYLRDFKNGNYRFTAQYYRGSSLVQLGKKQEALADLQNIADSKIHTEFRFPAAMLAGDIFSENKDYKESSEYYSIARSSAQNMEERLLSTFAEAESRSKSGDYSQAIALLTSLSTAPGVSEAKQQEARYLTGEMHMATQDTATAISIFKTLSEAGNGSLLGAKSAYQWVCIQAERMQVEGAEETALLLKDQYAGQKEWVIKAYVRLAEAYRQAGDTFQASALLEYILSQPEDYYPGMLESARQQQALLMGSPQNASPTEELKDKDTQKNKKK